MSDMNVPVNIATVQHFKDSSSREMLAQVFLVEPEVATVKELATSKSRSRVTLETLQAVADENGIGESYRKVRNGVGGVLEAHATVEYAGYSWKLDASRRRLVLAIGATPAEGGGLWFRIHATRLVDYLGINLKELRTWLPESIDDYVVSGWVVPFEDDGDNPVGWQGAFRTVEEVDRFIDGLRAAAGQ